MKNRPNLELLKTFIPLVLYSVLLYATFTYIDKKSMSSRTIFLILLSTVLLFYIINYRLIYIGTGRGVYALLIIMLVAMGVKIYTLLSIVESFHVYLSYGLLSLGIIATGVVFYFRNSKLNILQSIDLSTDKDEYVLNESVNVSIDIDPVKTIHIDKLKVFLIMSENTAVYKGKVLDKIVYQEEKTVLKGKTFKEQELINLHFDIPVDSMTTFYGNYNSIFWYVKLVVFIGNSSHDISNVIDVKPEILLRQGQNE